MNIILYTKIGCHWCDEVRTLLQEKSLAFEERECRNSTEHFDELVRKSGQTLTPTLDIDGEILADSDADTVSEYLKGKNVPGF